MEMAEKFRHTLQQKGLDIWMAPYSITPGKEFAEEIVKGIQGSKIFLLLYSRASNDSPHVLREVHLAVKYQKRIISVRTEDVSLGLSMAYYLESIQWYDALENCTEEQIDKICDDLVQILQAQEEEQKAAVQETLVDEKPEEKSEIKLEIKPELTQGNVTTSPAKEPEKTTADTTTNTTTNTVPGGKQKKKALLIAVGLAAVLVIILFFVFGSSSEESTEDVSTNIGNANQVDMQQENSDGEETPELVSEEAITQSEEQSIEFSTTEDIESATEGVLAVDEKAKAEEDDKADSKDDKKDKSTKEKNTKDKNTKDKNTKDKNTKEKDTKNEKNDKQTTTKHDLSSNGNKTPSVKQDTNKKETKEETEEVKQEKEQPSKEEKNPKKDTEASVMNQLSIGASIQFGNYQAAGYTEENADDKISWIVLDIDKKNQSALLLSSQILTTKAFDVAESGNGQRDKDGNIAHKNETYTDEETIQFYGSSDWGTSNIRTWLNSDRVKVKYNDQEPITYATSIYENGYEKEPGFLYRFTDEQKSRLLTRENVTNGNSMTGSEVVTKDKVFLLSVEEADTFLTGNNLSLYAPLTKSAHDSDHSAWTEIFDDYNAHDFMWVLRTPAKDTAYYVMVIGGDIDYVEDYSFNYANTCSFGIRPAILLDLSNCKLGGTGTEADPFTIQ